MTTFRYIISILLAFSLLMPTAANASASQQFIDGGYIDMRVGLPLYHFYTHDYQGNIRVSEDIAGINVERHDYYPYGALFGETSPSQDYLYGGKEWERTYGMNHYDFHARWMNPLTTRFTTQDPLQLDFAGLSSYSYCAGNPVLYIDPTGEFLDIIWDIGNLIYDVYAAVDSHISGNHDKATEHWIDAGVDLVATIIPGVPAGGSKLARMADDVVDVATDATKTADKVADASKNIKNTTNSTKINGNSKLSTKSQHSYVIINKDNGNRVKVGVSGGNIRIKDGKSIRAESQVRALNRKAGYDKYRSEVIHVEPEGPNAREKILKFERKKALELRNKNELDDKIHIKP